ncbi:hypothetical protein Tco_0436938, partial [Tanacetum coccineum]
RMSVYAKSEVCTLESTEENTRYVKGTESLRLCYSSSKEYTLTSYSNSDWHEDVDDPKSTSGYVFFNEKQPSHGLQRNNQ